MLVINYKGITPQQRFYSHAVKGNNNANEIKFIVERYQNDLDLASLTPYLKVSSKCENYFDKISLTLTNDDDFVYLVWTMTRKSTHYRNLELQLQFQSDDSDDVVFQTQIVELELNETINADKEISEEYPTILSQLEKMIKEIEANAEKITSMTYVNDVLTINIQTAKGESRSVNVIIPTSNKVEKTSSAKKVYGTDEQGNQVVYDVDSFGQVDDVKVNGVSVVSNKIAIIDLTPYEEKTHKVTIITSQSTDEDYPSAKAVWDLVSPLLTDVDNIKDLIPAQASEQNKLADKDFVNSSIATNTAYFKGTYNVVTELGLTIEATHEQIATALASVVSDPTNNDYVFVSFPDPTVPSEYTKFSRYKYNSETETWAFEFDLNNSSFTAEQWASINSGITSGKVAVYDSHIADKNNPHEVTKQQVGLGNVDNTSDADKPISNAMQNALNGKQDALESGVNIKTINGQSILGSGDMPFSVDIGLSVVDGKLCITYEEE